MVRLETRGPEVGVCNLCGTSARLTEDHIPPKGVPLVGQAFLERLTDTLGVERGSSKGRIFQRGVKYRSICAKCNNELLGQAYDPVLISFYKDVHSSLSDRIYVSIDVMVQQNRLFRSVVGHLLAHGVGQHRTGPFQSQLNDYFLDASAVFPPNLRLYCWVYPYKAQVVARGLASIFDFRFKSESLIFSILKFFPVAWMCSTADLPEYVSDQVIRVDHISTANLNDHATITLNPSNIPHSRWPEAPGKNGVVLHNDQGTVARPIRT